MGRRTTRERRLARLEEEARRSPRSYARKLLAVALLGYGALLACLLLFLVLPLGVLAAVLFTDAPAAPALVFLLLPLIAGVALLRALWFRFAPPEGIALRDDEAPALREEIERLRQRVGAPTLSGIVIDGELNAALATLPRAAGLLGHRHYLVLGLPLMRLLDRDELAAVIAHELGHAGAGSAGFDGWIQRMRLSLLRTLDAGDGNMPTGYGYVMQRVLQWYAPYLEAFVRARGRELEFQADAVAARATSVEIEASTGLRIELAMQRRAAHADRSLRAMARHQSHPPAQPHAWMSGIDARERPADPARILAIAARERHAHDSHPLLARRLEAIGAKPVLRQPGAPAVSLLGDAADRIERALDTQWRDALRTPWAGWHAEAASGRARLSELEALPRFEVAEALEHAALASVLRHGADAVALHRRVAAAADDSAMAHMRLADALAEAGEGAAADHFRQALALDAGALRPVLAMVDTRLRDPDLDAAVVAALEPLQAELAPQVRMLDAREGAAGEAGDDDFLPHALDGDALAGLRRTLSAHAKVARAWVVRRRMDMAEAVPHFVVLVDWRGSVAGEAAGIALLAKALKLPGSHAVCTGSNDKALARRVRAITDAAVYRR